MKYAGQASSPPMATSPKPSSCATTAPGGEIVPPDEFGADHSLVPNPRHLVEPTSLTPSLSTLSTLLGYMSTKPTILGGWLGFGQATVGALGAGSILATQRIVKEKHLLRLWGGQGEGQPNQPRQFSPPIQPTDFPTRQIRLEFDQTCLPYYTEIDAVCLLGTLHPITPSAKVAAMLPARPLPPILGRVVSSGLHVLPPSTEDILEACTDQLSRPAVNLYIRFA